MRRLLLLSLTLLTCALAVLSVHLWLETQRLGEAAAGGLARIAVASAGTPTLGGGPELTCAPEVIQHRSAVSAARRTLESATTVTAQIDALRTLGAAGDVASADVITALFRGRHAVLRLAAAEALGRLGQTRLLLEALRGANEDESIAAAHGLSFSRDTAAVAGLIEALGDPARNRIRYSIVQALGAMESDDARGSLLQALYEGHSSVRDPAANALAQSVAGRQALLGLLSEDVPVAVRGAALLALASSDEPGLDAIYTRVIDDPASPLRQAVIRALGRRGGLTATTLLEQAAVDGPLGERRTAIGMLGSVDRPEALAALERVLGEVSGNLRAEAARSICQMQHPSARAAMRRLLLGPDVELRHTAASTLVWSHPQLLVELNPLLVDGETRAAILRATVRVRGEAALPTLRAAMASDDPTVVQAALQSVGALGSPGSRALLSRMTASDDLGVAAAALQAAGGVDALDPAARAVVLQRIGAGDWTYRMMSALGETRRDDVRLALVSALRTTGRTERYAVFHALGRLGTREAVASLSTLARDTGLTTYDRQTAVAAMARAGAGGERAVLELVAEGDKSAIRALSGIQSQAGRDALLKLVAGNDTDTACIALSTLSSRQDTETTQTLADIATKGGRRGQAALQALSGRSDPIAVEAVIAAVSADDVQSRRVATRLLTQMGRDVDAIPALERAVRSDDPSLVYAAVYALQSRPGRGAYQMLAQLAEAADLPEGVRSQVQNALRERSGGVPYRSSAVD